MVIEVPVLHSEIQAAQVSRQELMKWKLVLVAFGGGAALGLAGQKPLLRPHLILCVLPFACVYVDLLCRNLSIRTKLLVTFLAIGENASSTSGFESFYTKYSQLWKRHSLESIALIWSSAAVSILVTAVGTAISYLDPHSTTLRLEVLLFATTGALGIVLASVVDRVYERRIQCINEQAPHWYSAEHTPDSSLADLTKQVGNTAGATSP